jgi:hypothetical protein
VIVFVGNESSAEQGASASADKTRCRRERNAREMSALGAGWLEKVLNAAESEEENLKGRQDSASEGRVDGKSTNAQHTDHITACGEGVTTCIDGTLPLLPLDHPAEVAGKQSMAKLSFRSTHDLDAGPNTPRTPRVDLLTPRSAPSLSAAASVIMHPQMLVSEPPSQSELPLAGSRSVREERDQKDQNKGDRGGKNVPGKPDTCANPEGSAKLQQGGSRLDPQQDDSAPGSSQEAHAFRKEGGASGQTGPHEGGEVRVGSDSPLIGSEPILGPLLVLPSPRTRQGESASKAKSPSLKETEGIGAPPPPPPLPAQGLGEAPPKSLAPLPPPPPPKDGPGCQQGGLKVVKSMDLIRKYHEFTKVKEKGFGQGANVSSPGASGDDVSVACLRSLLTVTDTDLLCVYMPLSCGILCMPVRSVSCSAPSLCSTFSWSSEMQCHALETCRQDPQEGHGRCQCCQGRTRGAKRLYEASLSGP